MVFNARRCASAVYCPVSVCPSVSRTQVGIVYTTTTKYRIVETAPSIARNSTLLTLQILMKLEWDHPLLPKPPRFYSAPQCSHCKRCTSYSNSVCLSVCLSVCPSVRPSHAGIVSKRRHVARCSLHCWIAKCV